VNKTGKKQGLVFPVLSQERDRLSVQSSVLSYFSVSICFSEKLFYITTVIRWFLFVIDWTNISLCSYDWPASHVPTNPSNMSNKVLLRGHRDSVNCLDVSSDGALVASGSDDSSARIWDPRTNEYESLVS
jgi:hypothetical protein